MGQFSVFSFVASQWSRPLPVKHHDLTGQTVLVLGANAGLGFEASKHFATMNPGKLILACRNKVKADEALLKLRQETGYEGGEVWIVDLADFQSVKDFAKKFTEEETRLDIFVANAATATFQYETTKDGWESTIQINHLSVALLALLLLPKMVSTPALHDDSKEKHRNPRLVIVSSEVHHWVDFKDERLGNSDNLIEKLSEKEFSTSEKMAHRYHDSKLLNVFFTRALKSHLPSPAPITVDTVNPGYCISTLRRNMSGFQAVIDRIRELLLARSTEVGSRQLVWAALESPDDKGDDAVHGEYISDFRVEEPSDYVLQNKEMQDRIWHDTLRILMKIDPDLAVSDVTQQYRKKTA